jgi:hypothetical protein
MTPPIDFDAINDAALRGARSLLPDLVPDGRFRGLEYEVLNPRRNDRRPGSFKINYRTGAWSDFATGDKGGDIISWFAYARGLSQSAAARELAAKLGVPPLKSNGIAISKPNSVNGRHSEDVRAAADPLFTESAPCHPCR